MIVSKPESSSTIYERLLTRLNFLICQAAIISSRHIIRVFVQNYVAEPCSLLPKTSSVPGDSALQLRFTYLRFNKVRGLKNG